MTKGWYGNKHKHALASRGIKTSESRKTYNGMPYHKTIGGLKFTLKNDGKYTAKINMPISVTEEEALFYIFLNDKNRLRSDDIEDLKEHIIRKYKDAEEFNWTEDNNEVEDSDSHYEWKKIKQNIEEQTEKNKEIIKQANKGD